MKNLTNIAHEFDALKPAIAADFIEMVTRQLKDLLDRRSNDMNKLGNEWSRDGNTFRNLRGFISWDSASWNSRKPTGVNVEYLTSEAQKYADHQVASFVMKLTRKLGDLQNASLKDADTGRMTFYITGEINAGVVSVEQNRIINCSPKGTLFHQWPAIIKFNGKRVSEKQYKALAGLSN